ncbi:DUF3261 domain-containing protein [Desulfogranum japonicum]|uniref:DUF3261 domain-containing protein n=1 Tax=Desulfogranum japonicum TaxID=231447 RepID=UPI0004110416|nr:DUF3261 domain-containing protein [Desulfogranum japonicum]
MKHLLFTVLLLSGCTVANHSQLPELNLQPDNLTAQACNAVFPGNGWQFVHSISFRQANGHGSTLLGVTTLTREHIRSALLTVEGLTLFEAESDQAGALDVTKALPPFDSQGFAAGLMHDIQTIFRRPQGALQLGTDADEMATCRFTAGSGAVTDVHPKTENCWTVNQYTFTHERTRSVTGCWSSSTDQAQFPQKLSLNAYGMRGYSLNMKLLNAVPVK